MSELRRRRGRPPQDEAGKRKEAILDAAIAEFGEKGYDAASMRGIAERADVDPALVHHYFDSKADLFADSVRLPLRPQVAVESMLDGDLGQLGERAVRYVLTLWENPDLQRRAVPLMRAAMGSKFTTPVVMQFLNREVAGKVAARIAAERDVHEADAQYRAALILSQMFGLLAGRYVLNIPGLADASIDDLVTDVGATIQRYVDGAGR
jgi:AcrR family transcriptional regulator